MSRKSHLRLDQKDYPRTMAAMKVFDLHMSRSLEKLTTATEELLSTLAEEVGQKLATVDELKRALEESVKLQSHYATLLNQYDGGQRMTFDGADAWLTRLEKLKGSKATKAKSEAGNG